MALSNRFQEQIEFLRKQKSQGNLLCFRNLKKATDEAITLFSNKDAIEDILPPYESIEKIQRSIEQRSLQLFPPTKVLMLWRVKKMNWPSSRPSEP